MRIKGSGRHYTFTDRSMRLHIYEKYKKYWWEKLTETGWQQCDAPALFVPPDGYVTPIWHRL